MLPPTVDKHPSIITMMTHDDWMPQVGPRKDFLEPLRPKITSHHRTMDFAGGQEESALVTVEKDPGDTGDNDNQERKAHHAGDGGFWRQRKDADANARGR
ncbi:hypothetical protein ABZX51_007150 [Aspergillus tubingensis]|uniref:Uncharacterized protein n=1 Tax=Aspergillus tubingensis (strain CBS 134.48) TaxID=767770 RepID=A0A1L9MT55_ASPTC|nr:hypothetical protein ASPTUDRAFT_193652 [Aspergillus tubingensis CBS 134.48]